MRSFHIGYKQHVTLPARAINDMQHITMVKTIAAITYMYTMSVGNNIYIFCDIDLHTRQHDIWINRVVKLSDEY